MSRFQRSSAGISSLVFNVPRDSTSQEPHLIVGCGRFGGVVFHVYAILPSLSDSLILLFAGILVLIDDSGLYETKFITSPTVQVEREYVGFDLDGPAHARPVAGGPAVVAVSKEGGLLRFPGHLGVRSA